MSVVTLAEVKLRLNKTLTVDDTEITDIITKAEAEYAQYVGPLSGSVVEKHDGGCTSIVLRHPNVASISAAAYADGTVISVTDLDLDTTTGIVYWKYNTAGYFTSGSRNVTLTYTVATLPENHRETIVADICGYFDLNQTGPMGPDDDGYGSASRVAPLVLFPRIRGLAEVPA